MCHQPMLHRAQKEKHLGNTRETLNVSRLFSCLHTHAKCVKDVDFAS